MAKPETSRIRRWLRRCLRTLFGLSAFYAAFLLVGLIPINRGFRPAAEGTTIYVISSAVHADIVAPIDHPACDWRAYFPATDFRGNTDWATHVAIGWGDRGFYLHTPTWNDLKASTALNAMLLPSRSVLHASCTGPLDNNPAARRIVLNDADYAKLCRSIQASFEAAPGQLSRKINNVAYGRFDAFYEARGVYHCFNTCNSWVGRRLADAGVSTPMWTPLPGSPCWYLQR